MFGRFLEVAALGAALCGCTSKPCTACDVNPLMFVQCQEGCLQDDGRCAATGIAINQGKTCQQTNTTHGTCVDGGCATTRCEGVYPCNTNPNPCRNGEQFCIGGVNQGDCRDTIVPKPDLTPCDGGVCRDGGCAP